MLRSLTLLSLVPSLLGGLCESSGLAAATTFSTLPYVLRDDNQNHSATFIHKTGNGNFTFALSAVEKTGDLYFHLSAPAGNSWIAVGTGSSMENSLMFIAYASSSGKNVTLSPRWSSGHVEPSYSSSIDCTLVTDATLTNGINTGTDGKTDYYEVNALCRNCTNRGKLDLKSAQQAFIFAVGPSSHNINSDSMTAGIRRHSQYGSFTMDMTKATTTGEDESSVPSGAALTQMQFTTLGEVESDNDAGGIAHALIMCGAFVIIFPFGVFVLRVLENVRWHAIVQGLSMVGAILGVGAGIWLGRMYNHTKKVNSAHQIIGLFVVFFVVIQFLLGFFHHRLYKKLRRPTLLGKIHRYFGPCLITVGIVNAFIGFNFADASKYNIGLGIVVLFVGVSLALAMFLHNRKKTRKGRPMAEAEVGGGGVADNYSAYGESRADIPLSSVPSTDPPAYNYSSAQQTAPREFA